MRRRNLRGLTLSTETNSKVCSKVKHLHIPSFIVSAIMWFFAAIGFSGICCSLAAAGLLGASGIAIAAFFSTNQFSFLALGIAFLVIGLYFYFKKKTCKNFSN